MRNYQDVEPKNGTMHAADEKPVRIFNTLIGINNNRIECYGFAAQKTNATTFRILFSRLAETSLVCKEALVTEVYKLGGVPVKGTMGDAGFFTCWDAIYSALKSCDTRLLIEACTRAENEVLKNYSRVLRENEQSLNTFQQAALREQYQLLLTDAERALNLCHVFTAAA